MSIVLIRSDSNKWKSCESFTSQHSSRVILVDEQPRQVTIYAKKVRDYDFFERAGRVALAFFLTLMSAGTLLALKSVRNLWVKSHERVLIGHLEDAPEIDTAPTLEAFQQAEGELIRKTEQARSYVAGLERGIEKSRAELAGCTHELLKGMFQTDLEDQLRYLSKAQARLTESLANLERYRASHPDLRAQTT